MKPLMEELFCTEGVGSVYRVTLKQNWRLSTQYMFDGREAMEALLREETVPSLNIEGDLGGHRVRSYLL